MKNKRSLLILACVILFAGSAFAQQTLPGKVIEVLDGSTVVVEMSSGKLTAVLAYVEVPEPEQPLNLVVKDHLKGLLLNKNIEFRATGMMPPKTLGQVYLNGVDIGQQMVRDGAAWHIPADKTGQSKEESDQYESFQALAKSEKRGIWSAGDMKPAWQFRAEREESLRRAEEAKWQRASMTNRYASQSAANKTMPNSSAGVNNAGALINKYDPKSKTGSLETPMLGTQDLTNSGRKMGCSFGYYYHEVTAKSRTGTFVLSMVWVDTPRISSSVDLVMKVDGATVGTAHGKRTKQSAGTSMVETLAFEMTRAQVEKIANGSDVGLWLGNEVMIPMPGFQMLLFNLLDAAK